jgi:hypothetical protein
MPRRDWDDDPDDRPRRRRFEDEDDEPRRPSGGSSTGLLIGGFALLLVLLIACGIGGVLAFRKAQVAQEQDVAREAETQAKAKDLQDPAPVVEGPRAGPGPNRPVVPAQIEGQGVTRMVFAGGPTGVTGLVGIRRDAAGTRVDVVDTPTGRVRGQVVTGNISINEVGLSPDGRFAVIVKSAPGEGHEVRLYDVAAGNELKRFTPYNRELGGLGVPELVWVAFVAPDRLLTINEGSGFDVWTVPDLQKLAGRPPRKAHAQPRVSVNGFTHSPNNFALTPDNKTLALFNGEGFSFHDARTADLLGQTEPIMDGNRSANFWGAAIRADGSRFVCHYAAYGKAWGDVVAVWEVPTGRLVSAARRKDGPSSAGLAWLGRDHLAIWQGGISSADLMRVSTGEVVGKVRFRDTGILGTVPPGDGLWGFAPRDRDGKDNPAIIRADAPAVIRPGAQLRFGPDGLVENQ